MTYPPKEREHTMKLANAKVPMVPTFLSARLRQVRLMAGEATAKNMIINIWSSEVDALLLLPGEGQGDLRGRIKGGSISESIIPYTRDGSEIVDR